MSQVQLSPVPFHGNTLFIANHQDEPFTPMKSIVEGMGLSWPAQQKKLNENKERWGVANIATPTSSGIQSMLCMPVRKLPAFFGSISPHKVRKELRERIITYQNECDDVLWKYWTGQQLSHPTPNALPSSFATPTQRKPLDKLVKVWATLVGGDAGVYSRLWAQVDAHLGVVGIDQATPKQIRQAVQFVQGRIDELQQPKKSLPSIITLEEQIKPHFAEIRAHFQAAAEHEREIYEIIRKASQPTLNNYGTTKCSVQVNNFTVMDKIWYSINSAMDAVEAHTKTMCIMTRL